MNLNEKKCRCICISDEMIKQNVVDQLYWDNRVDASNIQVEVNGGTVSLSGSVTNFKSKDAAFLDACSVPGVRSINNKILVQYPEKEELPSDAEIKSKIDDVIGWNLSLDPVEIRVDVKSGFVTLEGSVNALWKKAAVREIAANIHGVLGITNKLAIIPLDKHEDEDIAQDIIDALYRNVNIDVDEIDVEVVNGEVTLTGIVSGWKEHEALIDTARNTKGAREINDQTVIKIK